MPMFASSPDRDGAALEGFPDLQARPPRTRTAGSDHTWQGTPETDNLEADVITIIVIYHEVLFAEEA